MGDHQGRHADLSQKRVHALDELGTSDGVEGSKGFIQQNDLGLCGQCARQRHSLSLTTRELAWPTGAELRGWQSHELERHGGKLDRRGHAP